MTTNQSNIRKGWRIIWKEYPQGYDNLNIQNVLSYGAVGDGSTIDTTAWQNALNAIPSNGGVLYAPPVGYFQLDNTLTLDDKKSTILLGSEAPHVNANSATNMPGALRVSSASWPATRPMLLLSHDIGLNQEAAGGVLLTGLGFYAGLNTASGGYGIEVRKLTTDTGFWGDITLDGCCIFNANYGFYLNQNSATDGFGWIKIFQTRIQACNYGIYSNGTLNDFSVVDSIIRQNKIASNSSYTSRTGGAIYMVKCQKGLIMGNDFEGSQVGIHAVGTTTSVNGVINNLEIRNNYFEVMFDSMASLAGCDDVVIENNYTDNQGYRSKEIYVTNCNRVTQRNNKESYFICDRDNRDLVTDTPKLTRFTVKNTGSQTIEDYGYWYHSIPAKMPMVRPARMAHYAPESLSVSNVTLSAYTGVGPFGTSGKALVAQASNATSHVQIGWDTTQISATLGQFIVITARLFYPTTNDATTGSGNFRVDEDINGGGYQNRADLGITRRAVALGEWVTFQWVHKVVAGDISGGVCLYRARLRLSDASGATDPFVFAGVALTVGDTPAVDPMDGVISCESGATEFQYYLHDGNGNYWGAAKPTGSLLTWYDGERVFLTPCASASSQGYTVTVSGTGGGTARFAAWAADGAEAA